jgi:hypothetical protein
MYSHIGVENKAISDCIYSLVSMLILNFTCSSEMIAKVVKYIRVLICLTAVMLFLSAMLLKEYPEIVVILTAVNTGAFMNVTKIGFSEMINKQFKETNRTIYGSRYVQLFSLMSGIASITILVIPKLEIEIIVYIQLVAVVIMIVTDIWKTCILKKNIELVNKK